MATEAITLYGNVGLMSWISIRSIKQWIPAGGRELAYSPDYSYTLGLRYAESPAGYAELVAATAISSPTATTNVPLSML